MEVVENAVRAHLAAFLAVFLRGAELQAGLAQGFTPAETSRFEVIGLQFDVVLDLFGHGVLESFAAGDAPQPGGDSGKRGAHAVTFFPRTRSMASTSRSQAATCSPRRAFPLGVIE